MRAVVGLIGFLLGTLVGWQIGLLVGLGLLPISGMGPVVGAGTTFLYAGLGALAGGLLGVALCLLTVSLVTRVMRLR